MALPTIASLCATLGGDLVVADGSRPPIDQISAVHISELVDPTIYLNGGELLLTTGLSLPQDVAGCRQYVKSLVDADVVALAIGLGPKYLQPPAALVEACQENDLPLLVVPPAARFLGITRAYWEAVSLETERAYRDVLAAHRALVDAAASDDPVTAVLTELSRSVPGWAATLSSTGTLERVMPAKLRSEAKAIESEIGRLRLAGGRSSASFSTPSRSVVVFPLATGKRVFGYLAVGAVNPLNKLKQRTILTACAILSLDSVGRDQHRAVGAAAQGNIAILIGSGHIAAARQLASELRVPFPAEFCHVLVIAGAHRDTSASIVLEWCKDAVAAPSGDDLTWFIVPQRHPDLRLLERLLSGEVPDSRVMISDFVTLDEVAKTRAALITSTLKLPPGSRKLGREDRADPASHAIAVLEQLIARDDAATISTIVEYIRLRGNWERTAQALGVHRNTVRHRLSRIHNELKMDIDDPDVSAAVWLSAREHGIA